MDISSRIPFRRPRDTVPTPTRYRSDAHAIPFRRPRDTVPTPTLCAAQKPPKTQKRRGFDAMQQKRPNPYLILFNQKMRAHIARDQSPSPPPKARCPPPALRSGGPLRSHCAALRGCSGGQVFMRLRRNRPAAMALRTDAVPNPAWTSSRPRPSRPHAAQARSLFGMACGGLWVRTATR